MATYCPRYPLWTPRNGRRKFRSPVHNPSIVLLWTSRIPSPSSSRAHSRCPGVWQTVAWPRPRSGRCAYAAHSSVYTTAPSAVLSSPTRPPPVVGPPPPRPLFAPPPPPQRRPVRAPDPLQVRLPRLATDDPRHGGPVG